MISCSVFGFREFKKVSNPSQGMICRSRLSSLSLCQAGVSVLRLVSSEYLICVGGRFSQVPVAKSLECVEDATLAIASTVSAHTCMYKDERIIVHEKSRVAGVK